LQLAGSGIAAAMLPTLARAAPLWLLEEEFRKVGTSVKWVLSAGSNCALEYLNANSIGIGSSAGLAALLARANGAPVRAPSVFSRPEWTALVVHKDSPIKTIADLKGKKVAATKGTDPYLFLLRALKTPLSRQILRPSGLRPICRPPPARPHPSP
jgi:sulfonate transport system substrate-binding protein